MNKDGDDARLRSTGAARPVLFPPRANSPEDWRTQQARDSPVEAPKLLAPANRLLAEPELRLQDSAQDLPTALAQVMPPHCRLLAEPET